MAMEYTVTVSKRSGVRGQRDKWRVSCFGLPSDDWNALGRRVAEQWFTSERAARKSASDLATAWNARLLG
jgi:hypothetical protein